ncbi:hypothetical protein IU11_15030 [Cellulosimicrobium sp. MM]|nr:hypothetical protein IU11_15030 [Cellulosimicrobium sp. MM]
MRREDDVRQAAQLGVERVALALGLVREDVDRGAGHAALDDRLAQRAVVHHEAARQVEEDRARAHAANCLAPKSPALPWRPSTWSVTTSACSSSSSSVSMRRALPSASFSAVS